MKPNSYRLFQNTLLATALPLIWVPASQAAQLVNWDVPTGTATTALTSSVATGVNATAVSKGAGIAVLSASTGWRFQNFNATTSVGTALLNSDYWEFSISTLPNYSAALEQLDLSALASVGTGGAWGNIELHLLYSTDGFTTYSSAGVLSWTGTANTPSLPGTYFNPDLTLAPGTTTVFRLVAVGASGGTVGGNRMTLDSTADWKLIGTATPTSVIKDLVWAGAGGANWNTTEQNFTDGGSPSLFTANDNVTIQTAGAIQIDVAGITAGTVNHNGATGTTTLQTGNLTVGSLLKSGAGTLVVSSPVSLSTGLGNVTLSAGILHISDGASFATSGLKLSGGVSVEIGSTATFSSSGPNSLGSGGATLANDANVTLANISNSILNNPFTKSGSGVLTLTGIGTQITGPVDLDIAAGSVVANGPVGSARQINVSGTNTFDGPLTLNGPVLMLHGSTVSGSSSILVTGATSSITSRFNLGRADVNVPVILSSNLNVESPSGNNDLYLNSPVSGAFNLTKNGNGVVELTASNSYVATNIVAGTLRLATGGSLGSGDVTIATTLQFNQADAITVANTLSGAGVVRMTGGGSVTLTGTNTYSGVTTVSAGTLNVPDLTDGSVAGSIGAAPADAEFIVLNGGTLAHSGAASTSDRLFTIGTLGGTLAANGSGPLTLTGTGDVAVSEPGATATGGLINGTRYKIVTAGDTDFTLIGAANSDPDTVFTATGPGSGTGTVVFANTRGFRLSGTAPGTSVLAAVISDAANAATSLTKEGSNIWSVTAPNTYTGDTLITDGTLRINQPYLANSSAVAIGATAILDLNFDETDGAVTDSVDTLTINGVQQPAGVYGASGSGATTVNNTNFAGIGTLTVLTGPIGGDTYADWAVANGIAAAAFDADFDNDGISNGVEYALGKDPKVSSQPAGSLAANTITFTKGAEAITNADVSWVIETSETLAADSWTPVVTQAAGDTGLTIAFTFTPGTPVKKFARLKVVRAD